MKYRNPLFGDRQRGAKRERQSRESARHRLLGTELGASTTAGSGRRSSRFVTLEPSNGLGREYHSRRRGGGAYQEPCRGVQDVLRVRSCTLLRSAARPRALRHSSSSAWLHRVISTSDRKHPEQISSSFRQQLRTHGDSTDLVLLLRRPLGMLNASVKSRRSQYDGYSESAANYSELRGRPLGFGAARRPLSLSIWARNRSLPSTHALFVASRIAAMSLAGSCALKSCR